MHKREHKSDFIDKYKTNCLCKAIHRALILIIPPENQGGGGTWILYIGLGEGGGSTRGLKFFCDLADKNHSNGLQHYHSTLGACFGKLYTYSVSTH